MINLLTRFLRSLIRLVLLPVRLINLFTLSRQQRQNIEQYNDNGHVLDYTVVSQDKVVSLDPYRDQRQRSGHDNVLPMRRFRAPLRVKTPSDVSKVPRIPGGNPIPVNDAVQRRIDELTRTRNLS